MRRLIAALTAVLLVGCTTIPTAGPIEEVPHSAEPLGIEVAPQPPADGASPTALVEGFLQALVVPESDYETARSYLTEEAEAAWKPTRELVIYEGQVSGDAESARVEGARVGQLAEDGRYSGAFEAFTHDFGLVQVDGEWRINNPPDSPVLSAYLFERYYARLTLYFTSRIGSHVVPSPVYVHETQATPSAVVEALLRGPTPELSRVVTSAFPEGAALGPSGATIDAEGVVTVDLTGLETSMGDDARRRLGAQLLWSLTSIPRVTGLTIERGDLTFALPGATADGVLELATQQGYQVLSRASTTDLYGVRDGRPGRIAGVGTFERWTSVDGPVADLAVSLDGAETALLDDWRGRVSIGPLGGDLTTVQVGVTRLRAPQYSLGTLWVLGQNVGGTPTLANVDRTGRVTTVDVDLPPGASIIDFAVSPTRARVALILQVGDERQLGVASVIGANPVTVRNWERLELIGESSTPLTNFSAIAWQAETSIAVAAADAGRTSVFTTQIDGSHVEDLGEVSGTIVELAAMARLGGGAVAIRTENNVAWRYEPRTRWTRLSDQIGAIAYGG